MAKIYSENSVEKIDNLEPKGETVKFLINYSKALNVITYDKLKFEVFLN